MIASPGASSESIAATFEYEDQPVTYVRFAFTGSVGEPDSGRKLDARILRTLWMTPAEIRTRSDEHRSPLVMKCVDDHLAGQRYPLSAIFVHPSAIL